MQAPLRVLLALRPSVAPAILFSVAVATLTFTATPFLVPAVADSFNVSLGAAAMISTAQLGGFIVASSGASRALKDGGPFLLVALLVLVLTNVLSAIAPEFWTLVALRALSGLAIGLISWVAWAEAFRNNESMGDVAAIAPLVGVFGAPALSAVTEAGGVGAVYFVLAALAAVPLLAGAGKVIAEPPERQERHAPVPAALLLLIALGLSTAGGSAIFVYVAVIGTEETGLSALVVSLAFSLNALAGVPTARFRGRRRLGGLWLTGTAVMAFLVATATNGIVFMVCFAVWGLLFWMGMPAVLKLLADRSAFPTERAGDAQAIMAAGRVVGPAVGGVAIEAGSTTTLGAVGGATMLFAALVALAVELRGARRATGAMK